MYAVIGYPGAQDHKYYHGSRKDAADWLKKTCDKIRASGVRVERISTSRLLSDKEAAKVRYQDGTKVYSFDDSENCAVAEAKAWRANP